MTPHPVRRFVALSICFGMLMYGQHGGIGMHSMLYTQPTMSQAVCEIWSMIALIGFLIIYAQPRVEER